MVKLLQLWVNNQGGTHYVQNVSSAYHVYVIYLNSYLELKDFCCYISDGSSCGKQLTAWWD